jgi:hypothetical protein
VFVELQGPVRGNFRSHRLTATDIVFPGEFRLRRYAGGAVTQLPSIEGKHLVKSLLAESEEQRDSLVPTPRELRPLRAETMINFQPGARAKLLAS